MAFTTSVDHYERMQKLQEIQHERERQRQLLEQQLNSYLQSGGRLEKLKAAKLQSYWKKVCAERKARVRNENLLRDFSRLESYVSAMSSKTERLKTLKNQYEEQVERMYPKWREKLEEQYLFEQVQKGQTPDIFPAQGYTQTPPDPSPFHYLSLGLQGTRASSQESLH
ncbi:centrosomal protein kizuna-like [Ptychodera flava]|uniref:centrosomal protein kizuna-like n=1 Tax=Ptychodera flava TaxID=63121 RepID=UPI00396A7D3A